MNATSIGRRFRGGLIPAGLVLTLLALGGCSTAGYYAQTIRGHLAIMGAREDIGALIADPGTPADLRQRLEFAASIRTYASAELALPDNGSYRSYVALDRRYVLWNVVATPALSLEPKTWCFPVAGCVAYRGYFAEADAIAFAAGLRAEGLDVAIAGAGAYSTLGWFNDPLPSTILGGPSYGVARTIFHELAHQRVYVAGDSAFNEAYAVAVERAGVRRWLDDEGTPELRAAYERDEARYDGFLALVLSARGDLDALYRSAASEEAKLAGKARIVADLRRDYPGLKASWDGFAGYDGWFAQNLNNAHLALIATYNSLVPAFERMLAAEGGDMAAFHGAVATLAALPKPERDAALARLPGPG